LSACLSPQIVFHISVLSVADTYRSSVVSCLRFVVKGFRYERHSATAIATISPKELTTSTKEGESCQGKCTPQQYKKRPENASGRNCVLDITLKCSNGVETKLRNRVKAETGPSREVVTRDTSSTGLDNQHRRSRIAHGQSTKVGCLFKVIFKQWQDDPTLYLIVVHKAHTNDAEVDVHGKQGLTRISEACKQ
jgi:hypothetical protein